MDISLFISRFLYRNRYQLLFGSLIVTILVAYFTQFMPKNYTVKTAIYTGIVSGSSISVTDDATSASVQNVSNTFDNLIGLVTAQTTLKNVSLRLLAMNMIYGNPNKDNEYLTAQHFNELQARMPAEVKRMVDRGSVERTYQNFMKLASNSSSNYLHTILEGDDPHYSYKTLSNVSIQRIKNSDMLEISYTNNDPGITTNTVKLFNEELLKSYNDLRYKSTNDVIAYFERELAKLKAILNEKEDKLTAYNVKNNIINYQEQTRNLSGSYSAYQDRYEDAQKRYNSSEDLLHEMQRQMDTRTKLFYTNKDFLKSLSDISDLNSKITDIEMFSSEDAIKKDENLAKYKQQLRNKEAKVKGLATNMDKLKYSKEGLAIEQLAEQWIESLIENTKVAAELKVLDNRRHEYEDQYRHFSPIGTELKRQERDINVSEQSYLEMLHALNEAYLRKKNIQLTTANLNTVNEPVFPLVPDKSKRWLFIAFAFIASFMFIFFYKLLIELLDRTLRDGDRTERLTGMRPIGAYVGRSELRYRGYSKTWNRIASSYINGKLNRYLVPDRPNFINIISIDKGEGKSFVARSLEEDWERHGLKVKMIDVDSEMIEHPGYVLASDFSVIVSEEEASKYDIVIVEYPNVISEGIPKAFLKRAVVNVVIANASRVWCKDDNEALKHLLASVEDTPTKMLLNNADRYDVEDYTGELPPSRSKSLLARRLMHMGLTSRKSAVR